MLLKTLLRLEHLRGVATTEKQDIRIAAQSFTQILHQLHDRRVLCQKLAKMGKVSQMRKVHSA